MMRPCGFHRHEASDQGLANSPGTAEYQVAVMLADED